MHTIKRFVHTIVRLLIFLLIIESCTGEDIIRNTKYGMIQGFTDSSSQMFLGIPYAAKPERWEAPNDVSPWTGILEATKVKPMCYQQDNCADVNPVGVCLSEMSEDCLYMNIFAPLNTTEESKKAVMVFIHGGGFEYSSGGADVYSGGAISSHGDVILVTFNYRLGAFGFLVTGDRSGDITGNYGILDQIQALHWVHNNIEAFGGDNKKTTLFGQSSGALSTAIHMTSSKVEHLFQRVIIQSAPFSIPLKPLDVAMRQGSDFAAILGCSVSNVTCLKLKSANEIATAQGQYFQQVSFSDSYLRKFIPWMPHIDGKSVPRDLMKAFNEDRFYPKPAILGTTSQEGQLYVYYGFPEMTSLEYRMLLLGVRPRQYGDLYKMYKPVNKTDSRAELSELTTDFVFYCPTRSVARSLSTVTPTFTYIFNDVISIPDIWGNITHCRNKVCHGIDIAYVFQSANKKPWVFSKHELKLSDSIIEYWTNFAKTGNPNSYQHDLRTGPIRGRQFWPPYQQRGYFPELSLILGEDGNYLTQGFKYDNCNIFDKNAYRAKK